MAEIAIVERTPKSPTRLFWQRLLRHRLGAIGIGVMVAAVLTAVFGPWLVPYSPIELGVGDFLAPPSAGNWFGTDQLGRDIFTRVICGARVSMEMVGVAVLLAFLIGSLLGLIAGYLGGLWDALIMRFTDALMAFPTLVLALTIVAWLGPSLINAMLAIAVINVSGFSRLVRGEVLSLRSVEFIKAAQVLGLSDIRTIFRHIWPNAIGNVIIFASLTASQALITESGLSFLGLGVQPPNPSWGRMISTGIEFPSAWWMSLFPGAAIFVVVLALNFVGDGVRDVLDRRLSASDST